MERVVRSGFQVSSALCVEMGGQKAEGGWKVGRGKKGGDKPAGHGDMLEVESFCFEMMKGLVLCVCLD